MIRNRSIFSWQLIYALLAVAVVVAVLTVGGAVERLNISRFENELRTSLSEKVSTLRAQLEGNLNSEAQLIRGLVATIAAEPDISQEHFSAITAQLFNENSLLRNIGAAPDLVIRFMYPLKGNEATIGLDYLKNEAQREAAERARAIGDIVLAGPVDLVQGGQGFISRMPVFIINDAEEEKAFWGLVSAVIDVDQLYRASGLLDDDLPVEIAIRGKDALGAQGALFFGREQVFDSNPIYAEVSLPQGSWQMAAIPKGGWPVQADNFQRVRLWIILTGIGIMSVTMAGTRLLHQRWLAETRLASAIDATEEAFVLYDSEDRLVTCNEKFKEFFKESADLFAPGNRFGYILQEGVKRGQYPEAIGREEEWTEQRMASHRAANTSVEQQVKGGRWVKIAERKTPDGGTVGFRVCITELKNAQEKSEQASKTKSEFLSSVSHELRTPLNAVIGFAEILEKGLLGPLNDQQKERIGDIREAGDHLLDLINDILDFSKVESGKFEPVFVDVDVERAVNRSIKLAGNLAEKKNIQLTTELPRSIPPLRADERLFKQMLINLLSNALKFTPVEGKVVVAVSLPEEGGLQVEVRDTGSGMDKEDIPKALSAFEQINGSLTRQHRGTGLGLAIVESFIKLHGGTLEIESEIGVGTVARLVFPEYRVL